MVCSIERCCPPKLGGQRFGACKAPKREGWFRSRNLTGSPLGTTPRAIASQSHCPPNLGGHADAQRIWRTT